MFSLGTGSLKSYAVTYSQSAHRHPTGGVFLVRKTPLLHSEDKQHPEGSSTAVPHPTYLS